MLSVSSARLRAGLEYGQAQHNQLCVDIRAEEHSEHREEAIHPHGSGYELVREHNGDLERWPWGLRGRVVRYDWLNWCATAVCTICASFISEFIDSMIAVPRAFSIRYNRKQPQVR